MNKVTAVLRWINANKGKFFLMFLSTLFFLFVLFPFDDLGDLVSTQVSKMSKNTIFLNFEKLKMSLFPTGLQFQNIYVESISTPAINAEELTITPSLNGFIRSRPYGTVDARGIFKGTVNISVTNGKATENGVERQKFDVHAQKLALNDIRDVAKLPFAMKGQLDLTTSGLADLTFTEQPDVDLNVVISSFELPPSNLNTQMGPVTLPELKLSTVQLKGRLSAGKFIIESGKIGKETDELTGNIKGSIGMLLVKNEMGVSPQFGSYTFDVDLKMKKSFQDKAGPFLVLLDSYKTPMSDGAQFKFKVSAQNLMMPPNLGGNNAQ